MHYDPGIILLLAILLPIAGIVLWLSGGSDSAQQSLMVIHLGPSVQWDIRPSTSVWILVSPPWAKQFLPTG